MKQFGTERKYRKPVLEFFDNETIKVREATSSEYGLRYCNGVDAMREEDVFLKPSQQRVKVLQSKLNGTK